MFKSMNLCHCIIIQLLKRGCLSSYPQAVPAEVRTPAPPPYGSNSYIMHSLAYGCFQKKICNSKISFQIASECTICLPCFQKDIHSRSYSQSALLKAPCLDVFGRFPYFTIRVHCILDSTLDLPYSCTMGDYRYTELSYKITSLISRTCCLGSSGLTNT